METEDDIAVAPVRERDLSSIGIGISMAVAGEKESKPKAPGLQYVPDCHLVDVVEIKAEHKGVVNHLAATHRTEPGLAFHVALPVGGNVLERGLRVLELIASCMDFDGGDLRGNWIILSESSPIKNGEGQKGVAMM